MADSGEKDEARAFLEELLPRILEDGKVDETESRHLQAVVKGGVLDPHEVHDIFRSFLAKMAAEVLADGVVTEAERERFRAAISELHLPLEYMPFDVFSILDSGGK